MCAVGAKGETRKVMADLIGAPRSIDEQDRQYGVLLKSVNGEGERPIQLVTANALWGQQGYCFHPAFKKAVAEFYDGAFKEVNYALPDEAMKTINAWVSDKTKAEIKNLIERSLIDHDTRLILTALSDNFRVYATNFIRRFHAARILCGIVLIALSC
jgi:serine protease inhibitor